MILSIYLYLYTCSYLLYMMHVTLLKNFGCEILNIRVLCDDDGALPMPPHAVSYNDGTPPVRHLTATTFHKSISHCEIKYKFFVQQSSFHRRLDALQ